MKITKQDIWYMDTTDAPDTLSQLNQWAEDNKLSNFHTWMLPQMVAWFGSWELKDTGGKTVMHNCDTRQKRIMYLLSRIPRATLIPKQIAAPEYARITPLILRGFKQMQNKQYEQFRVMEGLEWLLEPDLLEHCYNIDQTVAEIPPEELLQIRQQGLFQRTGKQANTYRKAESSWCLYGISATKLGHLPKLTQTIMCQIWLASPALRHKYQILDPFNWDLVPEPLVPVTILTQKPLPQPQQPQIISRQQNFPWDPQIDKVVEYNKVQHTTVKQDTPWN